LEQKKEYLRGLHTLRFFAALLVLLQHCRLNLLHYNIKWLDGAPFLRKGGIAVEFFFTLSGFLLTWLALHEFKNTGAIRIKSFFARRAYRILPLYFLSVFLGYLLLAVVYPAVTGTKYLGFTVAEGLPWHILMLPNYVIAKWGDTAGALFSLWTIGVEEQYYLFFPFLMIFLLRKRKVLTGLVIIFFVYFIAYWVTRNKIFFSLPKTAWIFITTLKFHFMLIGGIFAALLFYYHSAFTSILKNKAFQLIAWLLSFAVVFFPNDYDMSGMLHAFVFSMLMCVVSCPGKKLIDIEVKPLVYWGAISYGIYIFHPHVSYLLRFMMEKSDMVMKSVAALPWLYYLAELSITIFVSHISYTYYESYFIRKKIKAT
jgi:peptidoglycan/LPS O-acetylase OafA/YrhL